MKKFLFHDNKFIHRKQSFHKKIIIIFNMNFITLPQKLQNILSINSQQKSSKHTIKKDITIEFSSISHDIFLFKIQKTSFGGIFDFYKSSQRPLVGDLNSTNLSNNSWKLDNIICVSFLFQNNF